MSRQEPVWVSVVNLVTGTKDPSAGDSGTMTPPKGTADVRRKGTPGSEPSHAGGHRQHHTLVRKHSNSAAAAHSGDLGHLLCTPTSTGVCPSALNDLHVCESPASISSVKSRLNPRRSSGGIELPVRPSRDPARPAWLASETRSEADVSTIAAMERECAEGRAPPGLSKDSSSGDGAAPGTQDGGVPSVGDNTMSSSGRAVDNAAEEGGPLVVQGAESSNSEDSSSSVPASSGIQPITSHCTPVGVMEQPSDLQVCLLVMKDMRSTSFAAFFLGG
jgi:hypothetical protein